MCEVSIDDEWWLGYRMCVLDAFQLSEFFIK